ncbi:hypothetical protein P153DRAFT_331219 [Dothidotthia symphoricarpi CBS 119687]|uniref:BTB domain-containing protein n=1 Tax=Dothidotthia symphoricarpi CBS 119687 TaxID=1392245 RepID=A0A6A6ATE9_9PLEO|nr:uncharacterized protein P153DRAFT_331219 [Dothidotthia symphoricarpi CBS 119687]KAF2134244.1 hypothetical protein P153DRAFT_331219 [Dothidotthia symphoricarpi CBS 119687]
MAAIEDKIPPCAYAYIAPPHGSFDKIVTMRVGQGQDKKEFQVHRGLLCHFSIWFDSQIRLSSTSEVELPDEKPMVVETAIYWMYTNRFWAPGTSEDGEIPLELWRILALCFFASECGIGKLQNAALTLLHRKIVQDWKVSLSYITAYQRSEPGAPVRRVLVDFIAQTWGSSAIELRYYKDLMSSEFTVDLLLALEDAKKAVGVGFNKAKWIEDANRTFCKKYHVHDEEV